MSMDNVNVFETESDRSSLLKRTEGLIHHCVDDGWNLEEFKLLLKNLTLLPNEKNDLIIITSRTLYLFNAFCRYSIEIQYSQQQVILYRLVIGQSFCGNNDCSIPTDTNLVPSSSSTTSPKPYYEEYKLFHNSTNLIVELFD